MVLQRNPKTVGMYTLTMKMDADNFRHSAIQGIVIRDSNEFKTMSDAIVANRLTDDIHDVVDTVYTRDLFSRELLDYRSKAQLDTRWISSSNITFRQQE